ncbi:hypothetical protein BH23GEM9_BH23GEM9_30800 [soil metagenome]
MPQPSPSAGFQPEEGSPVVVANLTANDRLKRDAEAWLPRAIVIAVAVHFALFAFWPTMSVADMKMSPPDQIMVIPPELDLPQPPEQIQRPAMPVVSTDIDESVTIPPTLMESWPTERLEAPRPRDAQPLREEFERFVPSMVAPRLLNGPAVERALRQNYPPMLRDAGIGGRVDVNLWLDADGSIVRAEIARSSGYGALDDAALKVVDVMRLSPALNMGSAVRVIVTLPVVFTVTRD